MTSVTLSFLLSSNNWWSHFCYILGVWHRLILKFVSFFFTLILFKKLCVRYLLNKARWLLLSQTTMTKLSLSKSLIRTIEHRLVENHCCENECMFICFTCSVKYFLSICELLIFATTINMKSLIKIVTILCWAINNRMAIYIKMHLKIFEETNHCKIYRTT